MLLKRGAFLLTEAFLMTATATYKDGFNKQKVKMKLDSMLEV
jgi:hypothetical protein